MNVEVVAITRLPDIESRLTASTSARLPTPTPPSLALLKTISCKEILVTPLGNPPPVAAALSATTNNAEDTVSELTRAFSNQPLESSPKKLKGAVIVVTSVTFTRVAFSKNGVLDREEDGVRESVAYVGPRERVAVGRKVFEAVGVIDDDFETVLVAESVF